jgi:hypothetical protein
VAFWIAVAGHGLFIEPSPFKYLTLPSDSPLVQEMQANYDPYPCCGKCHNEIEGSFFKSALGPQCPECNKGFPLPKKTRDPPPGTLALSETTKDFVQVEKVKEVENVKAVKEVKAVEDVTPSSVQAEERFPYVLVWATLGALLAIPLSIWHRDRELEALRKCSNSQSHLYTGLLKGRPFEVLVFCTMVRGH